MIAEYLRLRPHELTELRRLLVEAPDNAAEYADDLLLGDPDEEESSRGMDTDKAWAALAHLLGKLDPPVDVIGGGEAVTEDEWGYDAPRLLTIDEVTEAARFLEGTSFAALTRQYDAAELISAQVYPGVWDQDWALSYLEDHYTRLVAFFRVAAADREPILTWMD
jgi:hypothetical protein